MVDPDEDDDRSDEDGRCYVASVSQFIRDRHEYGVSADQLFTAFDAAADRGHANDHDPHYHHDIVHGTSAHAR